MTTYAIKVSPQPSAAGPASTVYECPLGKTAIVKSCIAANTGEALASMGANLGIMRAGVFTPLTNEIAVTTASSVNLLAGTLTLEAGDKLAVSTAYQSPVRIVREAFPAAMWMPYDLRARGTTLIAVTVNGIWRSLDARNWTRAYQGAAGSGGILNIGTTWFVYTSATTALKSADDGVTWTSQAVTNAPTQARAIVVGHSGRYAGMGYPGAPRLTTSVDGITWTYAADTPQAITNSAFAWTGTHYITGRASGGSDIYRSVDGTSWTTVSAVLSSALIDAISSDGAGKVIIGGGNAQSKISTDHGASWATSAGGSLLSEIFYTGSVWAFRSSINGSYTVSPTGLEGTNIVSKFNNTYITSPRNSIVYGSKVIFSALVAGLYVLIESADLSFSLPGYGLAVTASLMEVAS